MAIIGVEFCLSVLVACIVSTPFVQGVTHQKSNELTNLKSNGQFEHSSKNDAVFELEVRKAQNISICNYIVEPIPDTRGSRVPRNLEHVKCNHIGNHSSCQGACRCMQTYKNIEVSYDNGDTEPLKLYVGCVCVLQDAFSNGTGITHPLQASFDN